MELELTRKQFRRLLDMAYIGNWILNSTRGEDRFKDIPIVRVWIGDAIKKADAIIGKIEKLLNEKNQNA